MKYIILIFFVLGVESAFAESCQGGEVVQPMQKRIDAKFLETYQNQYRFAQIYCREEVNCFRASAVEIDDVGGSVDTGEVITDVVSVTCTSNRRFGLKAKIPLLQARSLRTAFNDLSQSGRLPQLRHSEGRDLTVPRSEAASSQSQPSSTNDGSID